MNNKGFSMIELLGVIVIIAILAGIAIPAVTKYIGKTRDRAYDNIYESAFSAAEGKYMHDLEEGNITYQIKGDLYDKGYMDEPLDPSTKTLCDGEVEIIEVDDNLEITEYQYNVTLDCTGKCRKYFTGQKSVDNGKEC